MWGVVKYYNYNYHKNQNIEIVKVTGSFKVANDCAKGLAEVEFGDDVVEGVEEERLSIVSECQYTKGDGYKKKVFAVVVV